jgi:hypothetical protein
LSTLGALYFTEGRGEDGSIYFTLYRAGGVAWEREIGWSDYRAVEDHLLEAHEGQIEATCNTSREGYANRERYEISGPLVELFERRTADGRWLPVREARQVDAELADAARRAGERHPRTRLGPGATYRVRFPHWYRDDLETNGRRTFVALDTLRFLRGRTCGSTASCSRSRRSATPRDPSRVAAARPSTRPAANAIRCSSPSAYSTPTVRA